MSEPEQAHISKKAPVQQAQRGTAPLPKRDRKEDHERIEVLRTSLLAAQHWLDHAALLLGAERGRAGKKHDTKQTITVVESYFTEAIVILMDGGPELKRSQLARQMDETSRALAEFLEHVLFGDDATTNNGTATEGLFKKEQVLRHLLLLPDAPPKAAHKKALQPRERYEAQVLPPLLALVRTESEQALAKLRSGGGRDDLVGGLASSLGAHLDQVLEILKRMPSKQEAVRFRDLIESASRAVVRVRRWISPRPNSSTQTALFGPIVTKADAVRAYVGLPSGLDLEMPETTRDRESETAENSALEGLAKELNGAVSINLVGFTLGANRFLEFAKLESSSPSPSFAAELAKGILISMVGNLAGVGLGKLFVEAVSGASSDSIQAIAGKVADGALDKTANHNDTVRDRQLFYEGLILAQASLVTETARAIDERVRAKNISAGELHRMLAHVKQMSSSHMVERSYQGACHGFALLKSQSRMGTRAGAGGKTVSSAGSSRDYFGEVPNTLENSVDRVSQQAGFGGRPRPRVGGVQGSMGIARLTVVPDSSGPKPTRFEVQGMNRDMALAILQRAHYRLPALELMLEVHFSITPRMTMGPAGPTFEHKRSPIIVIDEAGTLVHSIDWESLQVLATYSPVYTSPAKAWSAIKDQYISSSLLPD